MELLIYLVPSLLSVMIVDGFFKNNSIKKDIVVYGINALIINLLSMYSYNILFNKFFIFNKEKIVLLPILKYIGIAAVISILLGLIELILMSNFKVKVDVVESEKSKKGTKSSK